MKMENLKIKELEELGISPGDFDKSAKNMSWDQFIIRSNNKIEQPILSKEDTIKEIMEVVNDSLLH